MKGCCRKVLGITLTASHFYKERKSYFVTKGAAIVLHRTMEEFITESVHIHFSVLGYRFMFPGKPVKMQILNILFLKSKIIFSSRTHSNQIPYNLVSGKEFLETSFPQIQTRTYNCLNMPAVNPVHKQ